MKPNCTRASATDRVPVVPGPAPRIVDADASRRSCATRGQSGRRISTGIVRPFKVAAPSNVNDDASPVCCQSASLVSMPRGPGAARRYREKHASIPGCPCCDPSGMITKSQWKFDPDALNKAPAPADDDDGT